MNREQLIKELQEKSRTKATMIKMNHYHEFAFRPDDLDQLIKDTVNISHQAGIDEDDTLYPKITLNTLAKIIGGSLHKRLNAIKVDEEVAQMEKLLKQHGISVPDRVCLILNRKEFINFIKETLQDNK